MVLGMEDAATHKVRENRLRRVAARQGLTFRKVRRIDARAIDYGHIHLVDEADTLVLDAANLDEVEAFLDQPRPTSYIPERPHTR